MVIQASHIELLQNLIRCKSITPIDDGALLLIKHYLQQRNFQSTLISFGEDEEKVLNLYSVLEYNESGKNLCFAGHTDVVPPGGIWSHDPFSATIKENILYGRGAVDMKSAIVAFIAASDSYTGQFGSISLLITGDEEGVAKHGTDPMMKWMYRNKVKIDHCIVGEPVSMNSVGDNIKIGARGSANFSLRIFGKQGHVAYTHMTDNPLRKASKILQALYDFNFIHTNAVFDKTSVEVTKVVSDSGAENVVPNDVVMRFNFRYGDDYSYDKLKQIVLKIVANHVSERDYEMQATNSSSPALWLTQNSRFLLMAQQAIEKITGRMPEVSTYGGTSDARFIRNYCEVIEIGLLGNTAHQINESVDLDDIEKLARIYLELISQYFS